MQITKTIDNSQIVFNGKPSFDTQMGWVLNSETTCVTRDGVTVTSPLIKKIFIRHVSNKDIINAKTLKK